MRIYPSQYAVSWAHNQKVLQPCRVLLHIIHKQNSLSFPYWSQLAFWEHTAKQTTCNLYSYSTISSSLIQKITLLWCNILINKYSYPTNCLQLIKYFKHNLMKGKKKITLCQNKVNWRPKINDPLIWHEPLCSPTWYTVSEKTSSFFKLKSFIFALYMSCSFLYNKILFCSITVILCIFNSAALHLI